ncbi:hypothetical protein ABLE94_19195 [Gordonia sp. VNK1]|uniref:hypothetical protein n=1 Tax=Gordonia oleivorans TaxID=3156618 RepID=UPI0032B5E1E1
MSDDQGHQWVHGDKNVQLSGVSDSTIEIRIDSHGDTRGPLALAEDAMQAGRKCFLASDFHGASEKYESAVEFAVRASDTDLEVRARMNAARALSEVLFEARRLGNPTLGAMRRFIDEHLRIAEQRGAEESDITLERALASLLDDDPAKTIRLARQALDFVTEGVDEKYLVNALIVLLNGHRNAGSSPEAIDDLSERVAATLQSSSNWDSRALLSAEWLRSKSSPEVAREDVVTLCEVFRGAAEHTDSPTRLAHALDEVLAEIAEHGVTSGLLMLAELRYELAALVGSEKALCATALQTSEIAAALGDRATVDRYLRLARDSAARVHALPAGAPERSEWDGLQALVYRTTGNTMLRSIDADGAEGLLRVARLKEVAAVFERAIDFAVEHRDQLRGDVDDYLAEVRWSLARVKHDLDRLAEAAMLFRQVRSAPAMRHPRFAAEIGLPAWLGEAHCLLRSGHGEEASLAVRQILADSRAQDATRGNAEQLSAYLDNVVLPRNRWMNSQAAREVSRSVRQVGLRATIAQQIAPFVEWCKAWPREDDSLGPYAGLFDFWGRGGFARVAAALREKPHSAIAVDAETVDEVRMWAQILCPLFETVVIKWKGPITSTVAMVPQRADYGGPDSFGGHGYVTMAGLQLYDDWAPTIGFANLIPDQVAHMLATEALPLLEDGRLVLVPAPVVGCTQSMVGWTDHLLLDFVGGVVSVADGRDSVNEAEGAAARPRVLDLVGHSLPYMADVGLQDLARVLDEGDEWVQPFQSLLVQSLNSDGLKTENWQGITLLENDFRDASRQLNAWLRDVSKVGGWHVAEVPAVVSASSAEELGSGSEPVTDMLRAITRREPDLSPWVPYWRLQGMGGHLDWSRPLDNPSRPSPRAGESPTVHSWLCPGTPGWVMPTYREA